MDIHRLGPGDRELLRTLRLRALADAPSAFGSTLEREQAFTDADWDRRLATPGAVTFVAIDAEGHPVGMVTGVPDPADPSIADLVGMWVVPEARRMGVGDALVDHLVGWAEEAAVSEVRLCVVAGNEAAERLYRGHGFRRTGCEVVRERDGLVEVGMACVG